MYLSSEYAIFPAADNAILNEHVTLNQIASPFWDPAHPCVHRTCDVRTVSTTLTNP